MFARSRAPSGFANWPWLVRRRGSVALQVVVALFMSTRLWRFATRDFVASRCLLSQKSTSRAEAQMVRAGGGDGQPLRRVSVYGFDMGTTKNALVSHLKRAGPVEDVHFTGSFNAVVRFGFPEAAQAAVDTLNGTTLANQKGKLRISTVTSNQGIRKNECRVRVQGFEPQTTWEDVAEHFENVGRVAFVQMRGYEAIVRFTCAEDAFAAITQLNGTSLENQRRWLRVSHVRNRLDGEVPDVDDDVIASGSLNTVRRTVWIAGYDNSTTKEQLKKHCERCGIVETIEFHYDGEARASVTFSTRGEAQQAVIDLHETRVVGNQGFITVAGKSPEKSEEMSERDLELDMQAWLSGDGVEIVDA